MDESSTPTETDEDIVLRAWDGDESVLADLVVKYGLSLEAAIARRLPGRLQAYAEDVVGEAIRRFWQSKDQFDAEQSLGAYLYKIALNVANDLASGHLTWQKSRNLEVTVDDEWIESLAHGRTKIDDTLDTIEENQGGINKAMALSLKTLSDIERDVIEAYGFSGDYEVRAGVLGVELGKVHCDGVPIPAGTIRQHKLRGKNKLIAEMRKRGFEIGKLGTHQ